MASDVETRPAPRYETLLEENLAQVQQKIRLADLGRSLLLLACLIFGYALLVAVFDLWMGGSDSILVSALRLGAFVLLIGSVCLLVALTLRRFLTRVNPYFAAYQLEQTIPDAKNSIINWLDLKHVKLPPAIQQAVGQRAARDVKEADPDLVASPADLWRVGVAAGVCFLGLMLLFAMAPRQFGSLMARAFLPLRENPLAARTTITLLKPAEGDAVVPAGSRAEIVAQIDGRVPPANSPGAPALHYRHDVRDAFVRLPLEEDINGAWGTRLSADQIRTGVRYKLTAGDAETPEYRLTVSAQPFVTRFQVEYTYRPYRKVPPETIVFPNEISHHPRLVGHRGTGIVLRAQANTPLRAGSLELEAAGKRRLIAGEPQPADANTLAFRFPLEKSGSFRLLLDAADGTKNVDRNAYQIDVLEDGVPYVELIKPGKDVEAPANGTVLLAGVAIDDFGIQSLKLHMKVEGKNPLTLASIPYPDKNLKFDNGSYVPSVRYAEVLALDQLRDAAGKVVVLTPGSEVAYWLEARDNNDYPQPGTGRSKTFRIKILEPAKNEAQQQQERQNAQKEKKEQDGKQQQDQQKGNQERSEQAKKGDDSKSSGAPSPDDAQKQKLENDLQKTADKLNQALPPKDPQQSEPKDKDQGAKDSSPDKQGAGEPSSSPKTKEDGKGEPAEGTSSDPMKGTGKDKKDKASDKQEGKGKKGDPKSGAQGGGEKTKDGDSPKKKDQKAGEGGGEGETRKQSDSSPNKDPKSETTGKGSGDKGTPKTSDRKDENAEKGEGKVSPSAKSEKSDTIPKGEAKQGDPKEGDATGQKGEVKKGPGDSTKAAKAKEGKQSDSPGQAKDGEAKKDAAFAKGDSQGKKGPPTRDDLEKLKDLLAKGGPEADKAAKDLAQRGKDLGDSDLRKDLEDILRQAGRDEELKELGKGEEKLPEPGKIDPVTGQPMAAKDQTAPKDKGMAPDKSPGKGNLPTDKTEGGASYTDDLKPLTPEEAFRRRLGNLQLENLDDLKKRVTKDIRDKAGISDADWQQFLRNAQEYQRLLQQAKKRDEAKSMLRGKAGVLPGQGPRQVRSAPNAVVDPLTGSQAQPPLEFQDAQRRFTRKDSP